MSKLLIGVAIGTVLWLTFAAKPAIPQQPKVPFHIGLIQAMEAGKFRQPRRWSQVRNGQVVIVFD